MKIRVAPLLLSAMAFLLPSLPALAIEPGVVERQAMTVNGFKVDRYVWLDSRNRPRSVSLKRQGEGNAGNGGYAIQMTYEYKNSAGNWRTITANAGSGDIGFGYFVGHERWRDYAGVNEDDPTKNYSIAKYIFNKDDSPLGRGFAAVGAPVATAKPGVAIHSFKILYPRYGTVDGYGGNAQVPTTPSAFKRYDMPVTTFWVFEAGKDFPRLRTEIDFANVPSSRVSFDLRGPYGALTFDNGVDGAITKVSWGDRFHFETLGAGPVTRSSAWTWNQPNTGSLYTALTAGGFEMGLVTDLPRTESVIKQGFSFGRGMTSETYRCEDTGYRLPCDWEWPMQSAQYSLPYTANTPTTGKKIAWGSAAFYGHGSSVPVVYDSPTTSMPFRGYPSATGILGYDICIVLGRQVGITKAVAAKTSANNSCARRDFR